MFRKESGENWEVKTRSKRAVRLTPQQKKAVWSLTRENAGAGWHSPYEDWTVQDPIAIERGTREDDY